MKVTDLLEHIKYSDMSTSSAVSKYKDANAAKSAEGLAQLLSYINLGLIDLHNRFALKTKAIMKDVYPDVPFIELRDPSLGTLLDCFSDQREPLEFPAINDVEFDIAEVSKNTFMVSNPYVTKVIFVYTIVPTTIKTKEDELDLPDMLIEALLLYICYKGFGTLTSSVNQVPTYQNDYYRKRYEAMCDYMKSTGFDTIADVRGKNIQNAGLV